MSIKESMVLCLSGFDPTGGAGMLADIKTIEATGAYGMGILSANTIQTEDQFISIEWINQEYLINQLTTLLKTYQFKAVKIGIIKNLSLLEIVIGIINEKNPDLKIIWDPVLKSTSGHEFHSQINQDLLINILSRINLITPNLIEYKVLFENKPANELTINCPVLLKGGHGNSLQITDRLYINDKEYQFNGTRSKHSKHGSGCVLSSAIAGFLAQNNSLIEACEKAKKYLNYFIDSDQSLLGKHLYNND